MTFQEKETPREPDERTRGAVASEGFIVQDEK